VSVTAIVLAAGLSSRLGEPKQLAVVDGEPMVVRAVKLALQCGADQILVVTGAYADAVEAALAPLVASAEQPIRLVHNPAFTSGQASSIRTAIQSIGTDSGAALFLPVDQPFLSPELLQRLIAAWQAGARIAASAVDGELRGAPAIFDRSLFAELLALEGDVGARPLLRKYRAEIVGVPATAAELRDIDTPEELAEANSG
jgi:molybdenum cofactor cytidylyltransferase